MTRERREREKDKDRERERIGRDRISDLETEGGKREKEKLTGLRRQKDRKS